MKICLYNVYNSATNNNTDYATNKLTRCKNLLLDHSKGKSNICGSLTF